MSVNVGTATGYLDLDFSKFSNGFKSAAKELGAFSDKTKTVDQKFTAMGNGLKTMGASLTKTVTLPLTGIGVASVATAAKFEAGMSKVQAISGATGDDLQSLENMAKDLGSTTKFSATEAAEALSYMGMAGWDTQSMLDGLPGVLDLAAAGGTDLATTSDIVTDGLTSMGLTATDTGMFVDVMAAACASSNTSIELMGETLKYVGPVAGALGIDMQSLSSAIGLMGNAGIKGSQAGTALRAGLNRLISPTKESAAEMKKYGIEIQKNSDGSVDLMSTMHLLRGKLGELDETTQAAALSTIFGTEAMSGWAAIVNASESDFEKLNESIFNADGSAKQMAETMQDNLSGQLTNLKSAIEGAAISIGESLMPMVKNLVTGLNNLVTWFNTLNPGTQQAIVLFGLVAAAIGPALMIIGQMSIGIGALASAFSFLSIAKLKDIAETAMLHLMYAKDAVVKGLSTAATIAQTAATVAWNAVCVIATTVTTALGAAIAFLTSPIGLVILAITALVAAGIWLYKNWDMVKAKCTEIWQNNIQPVIETVTTAISNFVKAAWEGIKSFLSTCWNLLKSLCTSIWNGIKSVIQTVTTAISNVIKTVWNAISSFTSSVWNAIKSVIQSVWNAIKSVVQTGVNIVKTVIQTVFSAIVNIIQAYTNMWKSVIQAVWNTIKTVVQTGVNAVKSVVSSVFGTLEAILTAPFKAAQKVISGILGGISKAISSVTSAISKVTNSAKNAKMSMSIESEVAAINNARAREAYADANDYSQVQFSYASARQANISDTLASSYNMLDTIKGFAADMKVNKVSENNSNDNSISINLNIDKVMNTDNKSMEQFAEELGFLVRRKTVF